jgi:parallel beta-helix repeat protein
MKTERRVKLGKVLIFVVLFAVFLSVGCASAATTYTVCPSGCDYASIQAAINAADSCDTIEVHSGTYYVNVNVTKQLILMGVDTGTGKPVVDAGGNGSAITLSADGITLDGFKTTHSGRLWGEAGIKITSNDNSITNNNATNNVDGINLWYSGNNTLTCNNVTNNGDKGIDLHSSNNNTIMNNNVTNNMVGLYYSWSQNNTLIGNIIRNNNDDGIHLTCSINNTITGNTVTNSAEYGIYLYHSGGNTLRDNLMSNNRYNFDVWGDSYSHFDNDIGTSNLVGGKPIYYLVGASSTIIDSSSNAGTVYCINCDNITVTDLTLTKNSRGIYFYNTKNSSIQNNHISNKHWIGINLLYSYNNVIIGNTATNNSFGISLDYSSSNTITGNNATNNYKGICLGYSSNNTISGNTATNNRYGIHLGYSSSNNTITGNNATNSSYYGISLDSSGNNNVTNNNINGIYILSSSNNTISGNIATNNMYGIRLYESSNNVLINNNATNNDAYGIYLLSSSGNNTISGNTAANNNIGIFLYESSNNTITGNNASNNSNNYYGLYIDYSSNNIIISNTYTKNGGGIRILHSQKNNIIKGNTVTNNNYGITLDFLSNTIITGNNISNNDKSGICLFSSKNNKIYLNNFINNTDNVYSDNSNNIWNSTEEMTYTYNGSTYTNYLGNYWYNYTGNDTNNDGIGDISYNIDSDKDNYPLMQPWENYFATVSSFDTEAGTYPSLMGTHTGTITPLHNINVSKLYTYPCAGTGGHTESITLYENGTLITNGTWTGYLDEDWHNITLYNVTDGASYVTLLQDHEYNYTIRTGSYPQILHATSKEVTGGTITCSSFVDTNGNIYTDWIPAISLCKE